MIHMSVLPEHMPLTDCLSYGFNSEKRSVRKISWHNNHREHGLGLTYL